MGFNYFENEAINKVVILNSTGIVASYRESIIFRKYAIFRIQ